MKLIPLSVTRNLAKLAIEAKRNSPHIFFAGGVVGAVTGTVLACKATLKLESTLDVVVSDIQKAKDNCETKSIEKGEPDYLKAVGVATVKGVGQIGRLYAPAVVVGTASIFALTGSHIQLTRRNSALTATLALVSKAYEDYRDRVREELGVDKELELYHNVKDETVEIDGKKQVVKAANPDGWSPYARFFDEGNTNWQKNIEHNRVFIHVQQNWLNDRLQARGYVFLNEAYDALGFEKTQAGQIVGWVKNSKVGDNHIDFGIFTAYNMRAVNNLERNFLLDFNVDGEVLHILEER